MLPISVFWELSRNMDRIKAEDDMRMFRLLTNCIGGDPQRTIKDLKNERGEIAVTDDPDTGFDRTGFRKLKAMMGRGRRWA